MTKFRILGVYLVIASMASWAQKEKGPPPPLKRSAIPSLTAAAVNKSYSCKGQQTLCVIPIYVRARTNADPLNDTNGQRIHCVATIDFNKVRTAKGLSLYFVMINRDPAADADKGYRFNAKGLSFTAGDPDPAHSAFVRRSNGDTVAEWSGGPTATSGDGWAFLPWIYFDDGGVLKTCHAADPLIANDG